MVLLRSFFANPFLPRLDLNRRSSSREIYLTILRSFHQRISGRNGWYRSNRLASFPNDSHLIWLRSEDTKSFVLRWALRRVFLKIVSSPLYSYEQTPSIYSATRHMISRLRLLVRGSMSTISDFFASSRRISQNVDISSKISGTSVLR